MLEEREEEKDQKRDGDVMENYKNYMRWAGVCEEDEICGSLGLKLPTTNS